MQRYKIGEFFQKYTMTIALFIVVLVFYFWSEKKKGLILMPGNIRDLIGANAYVFILATGMLLCILTGGNIDLSVGSVLCFHSILKISIRLYAFYIQPFIGLGNGRSKPLPYNKH